MDLDETGSSRKRRGAFFLFKPDWSIVQHTPRPRSLLSRLVETVMVGVVRGVFAFSRALGPERSGAVGASIARTFGPLLKAHRTALANIRTAYPDKAESDVKALARAAWDNLGRTG